MISLFRKIRQTLLQQNKLSKYLLYALGEIVLVVIGIMIAVAINNSNEEKKLKQLEIKYLSEIKNNLSSDIADIDFNINFNASKLRSNHVVLQYLNGEVHTIDSLDFHLSNLPFSTRTLVNSSGYENLKSKGLEIISNDALRIKITTLYEFTIDNAVDFETKDDHPFQYDIFIPAVFNVLGLENMKMNNNSPSGSAKLIDSRDTGTNNMLKNAINTNILIRTLMLDTYRNLKQEVTETIQQIEAELLALEN
jgi:hypothetical protein